MTTQNPVLIMTTPQVTSTYLTPKVLDSLLERVPQDFMTGVFVHRAGVQYAGH